jgi:hypothetical protein
MAKGLPLADPTQAGLLVQGTIQQAFGNWEGTNQTLDIIIIAGGQGASGPSIGNPDFPGNYPFICPKGTPLANAIKNTLSTALPNLTQSINISPRLVMNSDQPGQWGTRGVQ